MSSNTVAHIYIRSEVNNSIKRSIPLRWSEMHPTYLDAFIEQLRAGLPDGLYVDSKEAETFSEENFAR